MKTPMNYNYVCALKLGFRKHWGNISREEYHLCGSSYFRKEVGGGVLSRKRKERNRNRSRVQDVQRLA